MTEPSLSSQIVSTQTLDQTQGNSGNAIERVRLQSGDELVLKRVSPQWDWLSRATNDDGRLVRLWRSGALDRMPPSIDHALVGVEVDGDAWNVFMRDVTGSMLSEDVPHDRETVRRILRAVADMHLAFWEADLPDLCSIEDRYGMLSLATGAREQALGSPAGDLIVRAWDAFNANADAGIAEVIGALSADPTRLADELRGCEQTLIHGDLRIGNLAVQDGTVVLIDWGERCGVAPPGVELAWFIGFDAKRLGVTADEIVEDFRELYGARFDQRAFDLSMIGGLVHLAPHIGLGFLNDDAEEQQRAANELAWWQRTFTGASRTWTP